MAIINHRFGHCAGQPGAAWNMLILNANRFGAVIEFLIGNREALKNLKGNLRKPDSRNAKYGLKETIANLEKLDLPVTVAAAREVARVKTYPDLHRGLVQIANTLKFELEDRKFYRPIRQLQKYYNQADLFGKEVFDAFPSANNDIAEAGNCLALERGTACVLHLMRVVEVGLRILAGAVGVSTQSNWGAYLREIDRALEAKIKAAGRHSAEERFYAEARVTIDGVRMVWRNPTMHTENNYSPERAEDILISVRTLMRHLATRLSEQEGAQEKLP